MNLWDVKIIIGFATAILGAIVAFLRIISFIRSKHKDNLLRVEKLLNEYGNQFNFSSIKKMSKINSFDMHIGEKI